MSSVKIAEGCALEFAHTHDYATGFCSSQESFLADAAPTEIDPYSFATRLNINLGLVEGAFPHGMDACTANVRADAQFGLFDAHGLQSLSRPHLPSMTFHFLPAEPLAFWTHNLSPFLYQFSDNFGIRYYGLSYLLGFMAAALLLSRYRRAGKSQLPREKISDLIVALVLGVMIGGRLGSFVLYHPSDLLSDPLSLFRIWEGGMASHGGMAGVAIALAVFARIQKLPFLHLADLVNSTAPLGLFFGRIANFINGELWGKPTQVKWAVIFPASPVPLMPRHPSQLYEAGLEGLLLFAFMQWRFWRSDVVLRSPGRLTGEFLIAYAAVRALGETFREPDAGLILGLSRGTFYSIFLVISGVVVIALASILQPQRAAK
ncbi:MAG: prolipoprotein diacylglyceryl transferase [Opitutus sp.]